MASFPPYVESDYVVFFPIVFGEDEPPYVFEPTAGVSDDYTWDQFSEDGEYIDRTWDEWYGDSWGTGVSFTFGILLKALSGYLHFGVSDQSVVASQSSTMNRLRDQTAPFTFASSASFSSLGGFLASGGASISATASQSTIPNRLRDQPTPINYSSIFNQTSVGNATFRPSPSLLALFTQVARGNATYRPSKTLSAIFTQLSNGNYLIAKLQPLNLQAFAFELSDGALISLVDPYFTIKALQEIRAYIVPEENRIIECLNESRVNTAPTENRGIEVLQETRKYRIFTPAFKDKSSIPRIRGDY